jgi:TIR domain
MTPARAEREVVHAVPSLPPFFISYAHAGPESNRAAERFYHELRGVLQPLVAPPVGTDMGFFDIARLSTGVRWRYELASALGTCQVLVALLSVPYLKSEWCGKEWHAFTMRETKPRQGAVAPGFQGPIVPVRWAPIPFALPPQVGEEVQIFRPISNKLHPDLAEQYDNEGLFGLLRRGYEEAFMDAVWDLAKCIQQIYYSQVLLPRQFDPDELRNVFEGEVP